MPSNHSQKLDMFPLCGAEKEVATMQAVLLLGPGKIACQELPVPEPGPEDVVLKVESALTCGTDLKAFLRGHPKMPPPIRFGHEYSGTITACGSQVTNFREGDDVMLAPTGPCGLCFYCRRDQENLCTSLMTTMAFGGYAEYVNLPGRIVRSNMFSKPKSLPFVEAALLEPVSCVVFGLQQVTFTPEDTVVIIGAGGFGLLHLILLKMFGLERVCMVARNPDRARVAGELGACRVIARPAEEAREEVLEATGGRGADLVIECTASRAFGRNPCSLPVPAVRSFSLAAVRREPRFRWMRPGCTMTRFVCRAPFTLTRPPCAKRPNCSYPGRFQPSTRLVVATLWLTCVRRLIVCSVARGSNTKSYPEGERLP